MVDPDDVRDVKHTISLNLRRQSHDDFRGVIQGDFDEVDPGWTGVGAVAHRAGLGNAERTLALPPANLTAMLDQEATTDVAEADGNRYQYDIQDNGEAEDNSSYDRTPSRTVLGGETAVSKLQQTITTLGNYTNGNKQSG